MPRATPPLAKTPAEREAHETRIAELRAKRRARLRWLALRGGLVAVGLVVLVALLLYWLLTTVGGRDVLLAQITSRLPPGTTLEWQRAEGPASGPLVLHGVRFRHALAREGEPAPDSPPVLEFTARRLVLDPALRPLLGRRLRLDALHVEGATLDLPESNEPFELPRWPGSLPAIAPPMALQADDVRIDDLRITRSAPGRPRTRVIDVRRLRGGLDASGGRLHLENVQAETDLGRFTAHGDYVPADDYRMDLVATAILPATAGTTPPRLGLIARGDLSRMDIAVAGRAPAPVRATLTLRGRTDPRWVLRAGSDALDSQLLATGTPGGSPLAFELDARGVGGRMDLHGRVRQGTLEAEVLPSKLRIENQVLEAAPLAIRAFGGTTTLRGRADFNDPENARLRFAVNARGLSWGGAKATPASPAQSARDTPAVTLERADLGVAGTLGRWAAIGHATLARDGERARLTFDGRGDRDGMRLRSLHARMPTGALDARGELHWAPALGWDLQAELAGFDPGYFVPSFDGALRGRLLSRGSTRDGGGLDVRVEAPQLGGRLRGRPLQASGEFAMRTSPDPDAPAAYRGELALSLGDSRVEATGKADATLDVRARLSPLHLNDLHPDGAGTLQGTVVLGGSRDAPDIDVDLQGSGVAFAGRRAERLVARGRLPWRGGPPGALAIDASGLDLGTPLDTLRLDARGAVEDLQLRGEARGELGGLALTGDARRTGTVWQGTLASLQLDPARGAAWRLRQPARFRWEGGRGALSEACLASSEGGSLCASADWPRRGLDVRGDDVPLALAQPYLPEREDGRPWLLRGTLDLTGSLRPQGSGWRGEARVTSPEGGLKFSERARRELVQYRDLALTATFDPQRFDARVQTGLNGDGRLRARLAGGWDAYAPIAGELHADTDELTWLELFSPDIVEPTGRLVADLTLGGSRAQPRFGGSARLSDFSTEIPALAITLRDGDVRLDARPDGRVGIAGQVRSGEGTLALQGTLGVLDPAGMPGESPGRDLLDLRLRGEDVLVSDTRDLHAVADPDITVRYATGRPLRVAGRVGVPEARMDLERLDEGVSVSPDVVVLDPVDPQEAQAPLGIDLDLAIALGDDVRLSGFGLDGTLTGELRVRAQPGEEMTADGRLDVDGRYRAYGQKLEITRGALVWDNGPVADPMLDLRAEREVGAVTAGVDVKGRASAPRADVWSDPATSQSEALSYLALGRPLSTITGDQTRQINAASAALSAGGSLLASQLGARIGLDDAGVMESRALGGSVLGFGKYFSPRLYVGYGVSLLGTGQVLTLKYLLGRGFDIEVESSSVENRASVNWRTEK